MPKRTTTRKTPTVSITKFILKDPVKDGIILDFDGSNGNSCQACGEDKNIYSFPDKDDMDGDDYVFICKSCIKGLAKIVK